MICSASPARKASSRRPIAAACSATGRETAPHSRVPTRWPRKTVSFASAPPSGRTSSSRPTSRPSSTVSRSARRETSNTGEIRSSQTVTAIRSSTITRVLSNPGANPGGGRRAATWSVSAQALQQNTRPLPKHHLVAFLRLYRRVASHMCDSIDGNRRSPQSTGSSVSRTGRAKQRAGGQSPASADPPFAPIPASVPTCSPGGRATGAICHERPRLLAVLDRPGPGPKPVRRDGKALRHGHLPVTPDCAGRD